MKKFLLLVLSVLLLASCTSEKNMTITYRIDYTMYYPGHPVNKWYTFTGDDTAYYILSSDRGSNYFRVVRTKKLMHNDYYVLEDSTAPIEVTRFRRSN